MWAHVLVNFIADGGCAIAHVVYPKTFLWFSLVMNGNSRLAPVFISQSHLYYTFEMQMSITVGILDLSVCPNEAAVNGFLTGQK